MSELRLELLGQVCPLPVIELGRRIHDVAVGEVLVVVADDPAAAADIPAWCRMRGHAYLGDTPEPRGTAYRVRRAH